MINTITRTMRKITKNDSFCQCENLKKRNYKHCSECNPFNDIMFEYNFHYNIMDRYSNQNGDYTRYRKYLSDDHTNNYEDIIICRDNILCKYIQWKIKKEFHPDNCIIISVNHPILLDDNFIRLFNIRNEIIRNIY